MKLFYSFTVLFLLVSLMCSKAATPLVFNDSVKAIRFKCEYMDYLEDPTNRLTLEDILSGLSPPFQLGRPREIATNHNAHSTYWVKLVIYNNNNIRKNFVVELFDWKIDRYEAYLPDGTGGYRRYKGGSMDHFNTKDYQHKNFIFDLFDLGKGPTVVYFKIKSHRRVVLIGVVRTVQELVEYSNMEYLLLSIFYGVVLSMMCYNFFLYFSTLDVAYFYYVIYVASIGLMALTKDGLGFQFIWPDHPDWNSFMPIIANYGMVFWALMYARKFLNTQGFHPWLDKGILVILVLRTILFIGSFYSPMIEATSWLDWVPLLYIYLLGIISWFSGYRIARFYVLAFTLFFSGFSLSILNDLNIISSHPLITYGFNIGVLCEMLLLSLALADRIKILTYENDIAQHEIIIRSKENEVLKDKINTELEYKVLERTRELEHKNKELDNFVYRSSHDIKGPLKSIIGLTSIGLNDVKDEVARNYFEHILKSSKRLDSVVDHLLKVMQTKEAKIVVSKIDFDQLISEVFASLEELPFYNHVSAERKIQQEHEFYSDRKLLFSVLKNIVENSLKYSDSSKPFCYVKLNVCVNENYTFIEIADNGVGIESKLQQNVFDMFYKTNPESSGSGLGLYMTKVFVEKMGGSMVLESEVGRGASFTINLKNYRVPSQ